MKCAFVTGGAGFIGSHTIQLLKQRNYRVVAIDDLSTGHIANSRFADVFSVCNILDAGKISEIVEKERPEVILHFAAKLSVPESCSKEEEYRKINVQGTRVLLDICERFNINKFVFSSSVAVYGEGMNRGLIGEEYRTEPISPYGQTKLESEKLIETHSQSNPDFEFRVLRYANVSGAASDGSNGPYNWNSGQLIHNLCRAALTDKNISVCGQKLESSDGTCVRDYIHVVDLAEAHLKALESFEFKKKSMIWNCSYNQGYSVLEVVRSFERANGVKFNIAFTESRPGDPSVVLSNNQKLKTETLWEPRFNDLDFICRSTFEWALKHKDLVLSASL